MGYFKKVLISDNIAPIVDLVFHSPENFGTFASWFGACLFIVQIYCDFSGYSDMAYGSALLLGYELPENFRMPFLGNNFTELWRRWHISLSSWLREYLYFSLGGSRLGEWRHKFNLFFTMLIAGLWHGANWTFVIWGGIQGIILALESSFHKYQEKKGKLFPNWTNLMFPFITFLGFVLIGTLFRAESIAKERIMLEHMFSYTNGDLRPYMWKTGIVAIVSVFFGHVLGYLIFEKKKVWNPPIWLEFISLSFVILIFSLFTNENVTPFIYFQF
jgi:D-alanyl-lipoteichoic acid acyltransferase DltB (MBOAT superfamily)